MSNGLEKYQRALKKFKRENPNVSHQVAQQKVSAMMKSGAISGTKKKKRRVGTVPATRRVTERLTATKTIGRARKTSGSHKLPVKRGGFQSNIQRGRTILKEIDKLELQYKKSSNKYEKHLLAHEINGLHDKLDALIKPKRKSA